VEKEGFVRNAETLLQSWWWWAYMEGVDYLDAKRQRKILDRLFRTVREDDDA